jgi:hypothetical protein
MGAVDKEDLVLPDPLRYIENVNGPKGRML